MAKPIIVYIMDDDPDDQEFLIQALKDLDASIECFTAKNGQEGLHKLETAAIPLPSLIFLDLNMPRINGRQVLFELKNDPAYKNIPVIIYSTSSNEKDRAELKALGAANYLVKQSDYCALKTELTTIFLLV
jgi:CheY-like chemotaxis protein